MGPVFGVTVTSARMVVLLMWAGTLSTARHRIGEKSTVLQEYHSRKVASCRRRGNLFAWYPPMKKCMPLLEESPACQSSDEVLVLNSTTLEAQCMKLPCDVTRVLRPDGLCHMKEDFCSHAEDKELVLKESGYGTCDCPDLHVYWQTDDRCYAAYTRGPCADGEYVVFKEGVGVICEKNPCPNDQVTWRNKCVPRVGHGCLDSVHGHLILNPANLAFECTLQCPDGMVELELECYDLYSRGPCPQGQHVVHVPHSQFGGCAENPCGADGMLQWDGKCWQRGQYCSVEDLPQPDHLHSTSDNKLPHKREPVTLPRDEHFFILGAGDLQSNVPQQQVSQKLTPTSETGWPRPEAPSRSPPGPGVTSVKTPTPVVVSQQNQPILPATRPQGFFAHQPITTERPYSSRPATITPHHSFAKAPPHIQPPANRSPQRPGSVSPSQALVPQFPTIQTTPSSVSSHMQQEEPIPWHQIFVPSRPDAGELQGQVCGTPTALALPPPGFVEDTESTKPGSGAKEPITPRLEESLQLSMAPPPPFLPDLPGPVAQQTPKTSSVSKPVSRPPPEHRPQTSYNLQTSRPVSANLPNGQLRFSPETTAVPVPPTTSRQPSSQHSWFPTIPNGYLPPPPSAGRVRRHAIYPYQHLQHLTEIDGLQALDGQASRVVEKRVLPSEEFVRPQAEASQPRRRARRLDASAAARLEELQRDHGFHAIEGDHPFSGNFETTSEVQGFHISVNPLTYEVECSDAIGFYRTISFAHYKCRPGSRRDLLDECHHEGPGWTDYHPDRCPFGMRHNLLTGKCIRIR